MEVILYKNFSKRHNSTKQPVGVTSVTKNLTLKERCDVTKPSFFLADVDGYNYLRAWGHYYFIDRVSYDINGAQYIECSIDPLATWKEQILTTYAFVKYSSSDYSSLLIDARVGMLTDVDITTDTKSSIFSTTPSYILSVVGENGINCIVPNDPNVIPATLYQQQVADLVSALCIQWSDAQSCLLDLIETPIAVGADYRAQPAYVGKIDIGDRSCVNQYFNAMREEQYESISIPVTYNDFRLFKFVNCVLYLPFVGTVELDLPAFYPHPESSGIVKIHTVANPMTGSIVYTLKNGIDEIVASYTASCGRKLPINASSPRDVIGAVTHIISAAGEIAKGDMGSAVADIVSSMADSVKFRGSVIGSFSGSYGEYAGTDFILAVEKHNSRIEPSNLTDICGRPCGKVRQISGLTGYVETQDFSIEIADLDVFREIVNTAMDGGVYLE